MTVNIESGCAAGTLGGSAFVELESDVIVRSVIVAGSACNVCFGDFADIAFALNGEVCLNVRAGIINGSFILFKELADEACSD